MNQFDVTLTYVRADKVYPTGMHTINHTVVSEDRVGLEAAAALGDWFENIVLFDSVYEFRDIQTFESEYDPDGQALTRAVQEWQTEQTVSGRIHLDKSNMTEVDRDDS